MSGEPIWIECEGAGHPGHADITGKLVMCKMCGGHFRSVPDGVNLNTPPHQRDDVLARIERGDFL